MDFASLKEYDPVRKEGRATRQIQSPVKPERGSCGIQGSSWTPASPQDSGSLSCVRRGNGPRSGPGVLQGVGTGHHSPGPISRSNCSKHRGGEGPEPENTPAASSVERGKELQPGIQGKVLCTLPADSGPSAKPWGCVSGLQPPCVLRMPCIPTEDSCMEVHSVL